VASDEADGATREAVRGIALAVVIGVLVRVAWLADATSFGWFELPGTDDFVYEAGAGRIVAGDIWLSGEWLRFGGPYFYVLALARALAGDAAIVPRILHLVLGVFTIVLVGDTTRRMVGERAGIAASLTTALYGPLIFFEALVLPETLDTLLHALLAWSGVRAARDPAQLRWWALAGMSLGGAIQLRPNAAVALVPVLVAALVLPRVRIDRARAVSIALAMVVALAIPMAIRNHVAMGSPFAPSTAGINLYVGNGPGARGVFRVPDEVPEASSPIRQFTGFREAAARATGRPLSDAEADAYWVGRTRSHVLGHPVQAVALLWRKTRIFFGAHEVSNLVSYDDTRTHSHVLGAPLIQFGWLCPFLIVGVAMALTRPRSSAERLLAALFLAGALSVIVVFVQDRYRVPWVPVLIPCAVGGATSLIEAVRGRDVRRSATLSLLFAAGLALSLTGPTPRRPAPAPAPAPPVSDGA
jgi:4-amino-4-deoxy-L-arabinose transferase-like glycosyltransferase